MRVLLATDGSGSSAIAAELVANIRWPIGTSIDAVRVVEEVGQDLIVGPWPAVGRWIAPDVEAALIRGAEDGLVEVADRIRKPGLETNHAVLRGRPADALIEWIDRHRPDLVIVGTRDASSIEQAFVGSVSAELVDRSPVPVLVARRPTLDRVVLAVDGSDVAAEAVAAVRRWPFLAATEIRTLSVAPAPVMWWPDEFLVGGADAPTADQDAAADTLLEQDSIAADAAATLDAVGFKAEAAVRAGWPASTILAFAKEWGADLVVLGSHGRTGLARLLLGSVARNVLHHATCSVLVVRRHTDPVRAKRVEDLVRPWTIVATH
jgi:nucleotide-binding universal stress UspA family protein